MEGFEDHTTKRLVQLRNFRNICFEKYRWIQICVQKYYVYFMVMYRNTLVNLQLVTGRFVCVCARLWGVDS